MPSTTPSLPNSSRWKRAKSLVSKLLSLNYEAILRTSSSGKNSTTGSRIFYGVESTPNEDVYMATTTVISGLLSVSDEEAKLIQIVNAHRLPRRGKATTSTPEPDPIIVRFAKMTDRDRILRSYEETERTKTPDQSAQHQRISVRCDLPAVMKRERGRLSSIAYNLRKTKSLKTKIKIQGTSVVLLTKAANDQRANWTTWSE